MNNKKTLEQEQKSKLQPFPFNGDEKYILKLTDGRYVVACWEFNGFISHYGDGDPNVSQYQKGIVKEINIFYQAKRIEKMKFSGGKRITLAMNAIGNWLEEEYKILKSTNGGHNWQELSFVLRKTGSENTDISMAFQNENTGWVSLDKVIYKTTDGGNTWQKEFEAESNIKKLYYTQNVLYAFADDGLLYRYYFK